MTATLEEQKLLIAVKITTKLRELGAFAKFVPPMSSGPLLSVYRFLPIGSTKVSQLEALASDLAVALGVEDVLVKRLPGESSVAVFVPNTERSLVDFKQAVAATWSVRDKYNVPLNFGVSLAGESFIEELTLLPHLLIAGSTGSGKSTLLSSIIGTIIYCCDSTKVQLVLSDTKGVEFGHFVGAPHLLFDPSTSVYQTIEKLDWLVDETEQRLKRIGKHGYRNIAEYNEVQNVAGCIIQNEPLPYLVLILDELADLLLYKGAKRGESKIAEEKLAKIVQKSRAAGVHVIAATQRPSVNIVSGSIKSNFPARLTFRLPSEADSRTVIGTNGAEHLLSQGDMLYASPLRANLARLHAPWVRIEDIKAAVEAGRGH